jgi:hypothetical protein
MMETRRHSVQSVLGGAPREADHCSAKSVLPLSLKVRALPLSASETLVIGSGARLASQVAAVSCAQLPRSALPQAAGSAKQRLLWL